MIISKLIGGLGNQMFQYAIGRTLSTIHQEVFLLDISGFADYGLHQGFQLDKIFNCIANVANEKDIKKILGWQNKSTIRQILLRQKMSKFRKPGFIVEPDFHYCPTVFNSPKDSYLIGYWQSQKYFMSIEKMIRNDFHFSEPLSIQNIKLANQISNVNAVSLHVRRGDFANNPKTTSVHGLCSAEYYYNAINFILSKIDNPFFFVFSDDINWVKSNLKFNHKHILVSHNNGCDSYIDMRLMSLCKHHIVANSSFSWWGAWLNPNKNKIVISPKKWFANKLDASDLIPRNWICL